MSEITLKTLKNIENLNAISDTRVLNQSISK